MNQQTQILKLTCNQSQKIHWRRKLRMTKMTQRLFILSKIHPGHPRVQFGQKPCIQFHPSCLCTNHFWEDKMSLSHPCQSYFLRQCIFRLWLHEDRIWVCWSITGNQNRSNKYRYHEFHKWVLMSEQELKLLFAL